MNKTSTFSIFFLMSIICFILICTGFGNFYLRRVLDADEVISNTIHIHGLIFFLWMIFFILQNALVHYRKIALHKPFGRVGFFLALAMLISALFATFEMTAAGHKGIPGLMFSTPDGFFLLNINAICIFVVLVMTGLYFRKQKEMHKRFMLMATVLGLTPPAISRLPLVSGNEILIPLVTAVVILAVPVYEWATQGVFHKAYRFALPLVILILPPVVEGLASVLI